MDFLIILLIIIIVFVIACVKVVPQAEAYVVERIGSYYETWHNGLHVKLPFIDRISNRVTLKEVVREILHDIDLELNENQKLYDEILVQRVGLGFNAQRVLSERLETVATKILALKEQREQNMSLYSFSPVGTEEEDEVE